jgi:hypothetical protein
MEWASAVAKGPDHGRAAAGEVGSGQKVGRDGPAQWLGAPTVDALPQVKTDSRSRR